MNDRRKLIIAFGAGALVGPFGSFAQQRGTVPRIGLLIAETRTGQSNRIEALRAGLRELNYVEGKNIFIEMRTADGNYARLSELAAELARLKVDVIVAFGAKAVVAARGATSTIPIVVPVVGDPVALGLTSSLARPSGNITGSSTFNAEVSTKRLELLKEAVPRIARVAVIVNPANALQGRSFRAIHATAKALKIEVQAFEAADSKELLGAFSAIAKGHVDAIIVSQDTLFIANAREIAAFADKQRLVSAGTTEFAEAGGLIGYGAIDADQYRRGAYFVDKLLKGAKPGDLPIEQPTKFGLVINIKTAKALGIKIPQSILVQATKVIE
jgi:putative ABC transport system substrate-binding protein